MPVNSPWQWWRNEMPVTNRWTYLDHAAVAPIPERTRRRMCGFAAEAAEHGTTLWPKWSNAAEKLRRDVAAWLRAKPSEIGLINNTTQGINIVAEGFPWNEGDNVVIVSDDFPSNRLPWENQASKGVEIRYVRPRDGIMSVDDFLSQVDNRTRIVSVSWIGYATGYRLPISELGAALHDRGILLFLDAIQGLGIYPLNLENEPIDFLAADGHKWLLGPEGAGIFFIRESLLDTLRCTSVGWHSVENYYDFHNAKLNLRREAARFESGSANMVGLACLAESLSLFWEVMDAHGETCIADRVLELTDDAIHQLRSAGADILSPYAEREQQSSILVFDVPGISPQKVRKLGLERNIVLSCRGGGVRASIHAYNDQADLQQLAELVRIARHNH